ncbi:MAG TPA: single-stranded DNA-binding protein [Symbiobacteriaceae bacterium]|nr:single-stranded DNA-binding protein [Symbiobacteriaceae bacterium]
MLNVIVLIGRLTKDPELRYTSSGKAVATLRLAVDRGTTNPQGEKETDFIDVVVWERQAETVANYLQKGRQVAVQGRLQIRSYETQEGQRREKAEVVATTVRFLDRGQDAGMSGGGAGGGFGMGGGERPSSGPRGGGAGGMGSEASFHDDDDVPF